MTNVDLLEQNKFQTKSSRGTFGQKSKKSKKATGSKTRGPQESIGPFSLSENLKSENNNVRVKREDTDGDISLDLSMRSPTSPPVNGVVSSKTVGKGAKTTAQGESNVVDANVTSDAEDEDLDASFQIWRTKTKKTRASYANARHKKFREYSIRPEDIALVRTPKMMASFSLAELPFFYVNRKSSIRADMADQEHTNGINNNMNNTDSTNGLTQSEMNLSLLEYEVMSGFPPMEEGADVDELSVTNDVVVENTEAFDAPKSSMSAKLKQNLLEMKTIRKLCTKLGALKLMQDPAMAAFPSEYFRTIMESDLPLDLELPVLQQESFNPAPCGISLGRALMERANIKLLYAAGFEDVQPNALDAFNEITIEYMKMLGKLMKEYSESLTNFSLEEMLRHTLHESGVDNLQVLENYVVEDVDKQAERLLNLKGRMQQFLHDFVHGTVDSARDGSTLFEEGSDQFISGNFAEETGEDFFGFKELGLEAEFGMASLSVPLRLLQGRLRPQAGAATVNTAAEATHLRFDKKFPAITKQYLQSQVGLVQAFYKRKLLDQSSGRECLDEDSDDFEVLVEDEDLPVRQRKPKPRLNPQGKISAPMKRPIKEPNYSPRKKRKDVNAIGAPQALKSPIPSKLELQ